MKQNQIREYLNPLFYKGICHRGLWNENCCENSLKAFENALNVNMAIEFDVHITKDNEIVVIHDSDLKRITGKEGIVEDLTFQELRNNYKLNDGQEIPTLNEVFNLIQEKIPMVIELKVYKRNYKALTQKLITELTEIKDKSNVLLISFDPRALVPFRYSGYVRQLLVCQEHKWTFMLRRLFDGVDIEYTLLDKKSVQNYCKTHFSNVWTIENEQLCEAVLSYVDTVTFQHLDPEFVKNTLGKENFSIKDEYSNKLENDKNIVDERKEDTK